MRSTTSFVALFLVGCIVVPEGEPGAPKCDGRLQQSEDGALDSPFDRDHDGFVDGSDPDCIATYGIDALDCDDDEPSIHPGASEFACNDIDDDCNPDTPDSLDHDSDGVIACDDCDDTDPAQTPGKKDTCWDGIDNDCDGTVDNGCGLDYNGDFALDQRIHYACGPIGLIDINFDTLSVLWNPPFVSFVSTDSAIPGSLNGSIEDDGSFVIEGSTPVATGSCTAKFRWTGQFQGDSALTTDFEAQFHGFFCTGCNNKTWTGLTGTRIGY